MYITKMEDNKFYITICIIWALCLYTVSGCRNDELCLYKDLFANYSNIVRPRLNSTSRVDVNVSLVINSLMDIEEKEEVMILVGFFRAVWKDDFLNWDINDYGGVDHLIIPASEIWLPDLALSNSATQFYDVTYKRDFHVVIQNDGTVRWSFGGIFTTNCNINLKEYPFDVQRCHIEIENWMYTINDVNLELLEDNPVDLFQLGPNAVWHFQNYTAVKNIKYKEYTSLKFTLVWQRKTLYYYVNIVIPIILMLFVALGVFWLPAECGEKMSLAMTIVLAFSVFQIIIMENTPVNSDVVPEITELVMLVMVLATTSLLTSMLVVYISCKSPKSRPSLFIRKLYFRYLARLLCMTSNIPDADLRISQYKTEENTEVVNTTCNGYEIRHRKYPTALVNKDVLKEGFNTQLMANSTSSPAFDFMPHQSASFTDSMANENGNNKDDNSNHGNRYLADIANTLKKLHTHIQDREASGLISEEWQCIAKITDRMMFFIVLTVMSISLAYINH